MAAPARRRSASCQKPNGFVCGLSTRNTLTPWLTQNSTTSRSSATATRHSLLAKSNGIDVLVFLRRVLRVLHAAVAPSLEPVRMVADVRMIGRALERDVERDLDAEALGLRAKRPEILERAELSDARSCGRLRGRRSPTASPGRRAPRRARCSGPCAWSAPIGWIGGRYSTSKPIPATYARRAFAVANVPCAAVAPTAERGKNSYHDEQRASGRSTTISSCVVVDASRA